MLPKNSFFDILKIMSAITNFGTLLRSYANKQNSAFVNLRDFCDYIKKYAEHYIEEEPGLSVYLSNTENTIIAELALPISISCRVKPNRRYCTRAVKAVCRSRRFARLKGLPQPKRQTRIK